MKYLGYDLLHLDLKDPLSGLLYNEVLYCVLKSCPSHYIYCMSNGFEALYNVLLLFLWHTNGYCFFGLQQTIRNISVLPIVGTSCFCQCNVDSPCSRHTILQCGCVGRTMFKVSNNVSTLNNVSVSATLNPSIVFNCMPLAIHGMWKNPVGLLLRSVIAFRVYCVLKQHDFSLLGYIPVLSQTNVTQQQGRSRAGLY